MAMSSLATRDSLAFYFTAESVFARPSGWNVSLHTGFPGVDGSSNEVADANYSRQPVIFALDIADASAPFVSNSTSVDYASAASGYTASYVVVWDTTNARPLVVQRLSADKTIASGEQAQFVVGELRIGGRN